MDEIVMHKMCEDRSCYLVYAVICGSHAYGTFGPTSDIDYRGVYVPGKRVVLGLTDIPSDVIEDKAEEASIHSIRKFVALCLQGNPNIVDWLFVPDNCVKLISNHFDPIRENRKAFLSRQLHERFRGYAHGHFQKMERGLTRELGEKRKQDIEKFGYSTKNAMHLIRLARMGCEVLETGEYVVERPDAEVLKSIRRGEWTLEQIKEEGQRLIARMDAAVEKSPLPEHPDFDFIERLVMDIMWTRVQTWTKTW